MDYVVLVDEKDNEIGYEEKSAAHRHPAKLHRAFSIFVLNEKGELLIQRRNQEKATWPGFWSNSCCSHPRRDEPIHVAAKRRLQEELGFSCELRFLFKFQYDAKYNGDWGEHEIDHVFLGYYDGEICPNPDEVDEFQFVDLDKLRIDIHENQARYTPWFKICFGPFMGSLAIEQKDVR